MRPDSALQSRRDKFESRSLEPIGAGERIELIDVVRGFALYGVLLANLIWISQEGAVTPAQVAALPTAAIDRVVRYAVQFFIDWKFYTLFAFLFGLGFSVQLMRGEQRGVAIIPVYVRRLIVLLGFGLLHAYLVWYGDILHHYALLGFVLILFRKSSDQFLLGAGLTLGVILPAVVMMGQALVGPESPPVAPVPADLQMLTARFEAFTSGDYVESLRENARYAFGFWTHGVAVHFVPAILGKFLLGFYVGRRRLLETTEGRLDLFRRLLVWGLVLGILGNAVWVVIAVLLTQSVFYLGIFYGFGFTLLGRVGSAVCLGLSLAIFAAQILVSSWWLRRFRYGPAEWLWRSLTYGIRQPMRLSVPAPAT